MQILCLFVFLVLFKGSSKCGFFHLAVLFRFYRVLFLHHVFLSEQIKMMRWWWNRPQLTFPRQFSRPVCFNMKRLDGKLIRARGCHVDWTPRKLIAGLNLNSDASFAIIFARLCCSLLLQTDVQIGRKMILNESESCTWQRYFLAVRACSSSLNRDTAR